MTNDILDEFVTLKARNAQLVLENRRLQNEVDTLQKEKQLLYKHLLSLKANQDSMFDRIGKTFFSDQFYEE